MSKIEVIYPTIINHKCEVCNSKLKALFNYPAGKTQYNCKKCNCYIEELNTGHLVRTPGGINEEFEIKMKKYI